MSWQGNSFSSARARERGSALTVSVVKSGDLVSANHFPFTFSPSSTSLLTLTVEP